MMSLSHWLAAMLIALALLVLQAAGAVVVSAELGRARNATVVLHIGPHKTGSSYLQTMLHSNNELLHKVGYSFEVTGSPKMHFHHLALALRLNYTPNANLYRPMWNELKRGKRMIVSSETFSTLQDAAPVREYFADQQVHVVAFYRDPMTVLYSIYCELTRQPKRPKKTTFGEFVFSEQTELDFELSLHYGFLDRYVETFGRDSVTIVDYNGALAAGKDLGHVFLCDVVGVLCDAELTNVGVVNPKANMLKLHLFRTFRLFVTSQGCSFSAHANAAQIAESFAAVATEVPTVELFAKVLRPLFLQIDEQVRRKYGDTMLFGDPAAARRSIEGFSYLELDEVALLANSTWIARLRSEAARLCHRGWLVDCERVL